MNAIIGVIGIFLAIILSRPFTTLVHELGHALPALVFTKKEVTIYIGSYGSLEKSYPFQLGRLSIFFTPKFVHLQQGLCSHQGAATIGQSILIVLGGPVFSLLLGLFFSWLILFYKDQQIIAFVMGIFLVSGIFDFINNIIPSKDPLIMHDGRTTHNDGYQLQQLLKTSKYPASYFEAIEALNNNQFDLGIKKLLETAETGVSSGPLYQDIMQLLTHPDHIESELWSAISFHEKYSHQFPLDSSDFVIAGNLYQKVDHDLKAISHYSKAVDINYKNAEALFQRAKLFHKLGYNNRSISDLQKIISIDDQHKEARYLLDNF